MVEKGTGQKPEWRDRKGRFSSAIWKNERGVSIRLQRSYKNRDGAYVSADIACFAEDLESLQALAESTIAYCREKGYPTHRKPFIKPEEKEDA